MYPAWNKDVTHPRSPLPVAHRLGGSRGPETRGDCECFPRLGNPWQPDAARERPVASSTAAVAESALRRLLVGACTENAGRSSPVHGSQRARAGVATGMLGHIVGSVGLKPPVRPVDSGLRPQVRYELLPVGHEPGSHFADRHSIDARTAPVRVDSRVGPALPANTSTCSTRTTSPALANRSRRWGGP